MELMQLEMFIAVVEERSVRKAASRVFRCQPAISIALKKLEYEMGTRLLDRSRHMDYRPTLVGKRLYEYATRMIELRNKALLLGKKTPEQSATPRHTAETLARCTTEISLPLQGMSLV
jgi:DNA-binding transcriptional LysR family regulator